MTMIGGDDSVGLQKTLRKKFYTVTVSVFLSVFALPVDGSEGEENDSYRGKTIRFVVGASAGGGYDAYARLIAEYIVDHIPGHPHVIVENKPGASGLIAARYLYEATEPDGLTVATFNSAIPFEQVLGTPGVQFDSTRFRWIGAPVRGYPVCAVMGFTGVKSLADIRAAEKPIRMGAFGSGNVDKTIALPLFLNEVLGGKLDVIRGYDGSSKIRLAMQQKEIDGICLSWDSLRSTARALLDAAGDEKLIPIVIHGITSDPEVQDLPQFMDVFKEERLRKMFETWVQPFNFQRPVALPPGTPDEIVQTLRTAFQKTLRDPGFLAAAGRAQLFIDPVTGEEIDQYVQAIVSTDEAALASLRKLLLAE